MDNDVEIMMEL
jgi:hypothetical protein